MDNMHESNSYEATKNPELSEDIDGKSLIQSPGLDQDSVGGSLLVRTQRLLGSQRGTLLLALLLLFLLIGYFATDRETPTGDLYADTYVDDPPVSESTQDVIPMDVSAVPSAADSLEMEEAELLAMSDSLDAAGLISSEEEVRPKIERVAPENVFDILGRARAGEAIQFRIRDYNPNVEYQLDLGNGQKQKAFKETYYRYTEPGSYRVRLTMVHPDESVQYTTRYIRVKSIENEAPASSPQASSEVQARDLIAENTSTTTSEVSISRTNDNKEPNPKTVESQNETQAAPVTVDMKKTVAKPEPVDLAAGNQNTGTVPATVTKAAVPEPPKPVVMTPLAYAEKMPSFPGGSTALNNFFNKTINYPEMARENEVEGKVYVRFVVNPDGSISTPQVVRGIGYGCDEEALKVLGQMPKWIPGEQNGQKVQVVKTLPINFRFK